LKPYASISRPKCFGARAFGSEEGSSFRTRECVGEVAGKVAAVSPGGAAGSEWNTLRVRLSGPAGPLAGATVVVDYEDASGSWGLATLTTARNGEIAYRFRPSGWKPTAVRVTFVGAANLAGTSLVVPVT
jgi:hypothetical protein